jgi:predicted RND superfamily exporter protein
MFITSLTSTVAFASCIGSKIMPIQAFGVFAAIVVSLVYILTITFQPINYYIYDKTGISKLCKKKIK